MWRSEAGLPLVLIGTLFKTTYGMKVVRALENSSLARYLGCLSRPLVLAAMKACRVFALPSLMEGIGLAALEAGALDARIVVTQNGGPRDYFAEYAWYVDPYSIPSITQGLQRAWDAPANKPVQQHIRERFAPDVLSPVLQSFYEAALAGEKNGGFTQVSCESASGRVL